MLDRGGLSVSDVVCDVASEYRAARYGVGLHDRGYRGLIEVAGADRADWLHNLVTNTVRTLRVGEGNYAFAVNVKGRVVFDAVILIREDAIWLDTERSHVTTAIAHLDRYHIAEDVTITDRSDRYARLALLGPRAIDVLDALGAGHARNMAQFQHGALPLQGRPRPFMRHDFAGLFGAELFVEIADAAACWRRLLEIGAPADIRPVGMAAVQSLRIQAGIPWLGQDIDEEVLAPETMQVERGISYHKGCYLGQEVIERMRSRGALARRLVRLAIDGSRPPSVPARLRVGAADAGRLTSAAACPETRRVLGLGYLKTAFYEPGAAVAIESAEGVLTGRVDPI